MARIKSGICIHACNCSRRIAIKFNSVWYLIGVFSWRWGSRHEISFKICQKNSKPFHHYRTRNSLKAFNMKFSTKNCSRKFDIKLQHEWMKCWIRLSRKKGWIRVVRFKGDSFILEIEIKGKGTQPVISDNGCKLEMCHSFRLNYSFRVARESVESSRKVSSPDPEPTDLWAAPSELSRTVHGEKHARS